MTISIDNFTPVVATDLDANDPTSFDVKNDTGSGFTRLMIAVSFVDSEGSSFVEIAHDGDSFRGEYLGFSNVRVPITDGFRFTLLRDGGWVGAPTVEFFPAAAP